MRRINQPLRAKPNGAPLCAPEPPSRKVFNCIVDDTALIAGVKKSTRDGIRKWVLQGSVRLFVPLHTLALLDRLKKGNERINADAREAIKWLDDITSTPAIESSGRVQLEGTDEQYTSWAEVEKFMLPETLLSMEQSDSEEEDDEDYLEVEDLESSFNQLDISDHTSMSSSHSMEDRPKTPESPQSVYAPTVPKLTNGSAYTPQYVSMESPNRTARNSAEIPRKPKSPKGAVPAYLQPLFNHILWRIHQELNPDAALESYILLTNDPTKQTIAQRFGIRAKRLEQLRDAVGREDREYKNRMVLYKMENNLPQTANENSSPVDPPTSPKKAQNEDMNEDDEDVVVLKRAPRGPQATTPQSAPGQRVWDPNEFGRADQTRGGRGGRGGHNVPRGRGGRGGRGGYVPRGAYVPPVGYRAPLAPRVDPSQPIDPDSFARPAPRVNNTRGGRRKLWEPN